MTTPDEPLRLRWSPGPREYGLGNDLYLFHHFSEYASISPSTGWKTCTGGSGPEVGPEAKRRAVEHLERTGVISRETAEYLNTYQCA